MKKEHTPCVGRNAEANARLIEMLEGLRQLRKTIDGSQPIDTIGCVIGLDYLIAKAKGDV